MVKTHLVPPLAAFALLSLVACRESRALPRPEAGERRPLGDHVDQPAERVGHSSPGG